jgi:Fe-S-cluster containining protein
MDLLWHPLVDSELHDILSPIEAGYSRRELVKILATLKTRTGITFPWGGLMNRCPFLKKLRSRKYQCIIQDVKPRGCKKFPVVWSGLNTEYVVCPALKKLGVNCAPIHPNFPEKVT